MTKLASSRFNFLPRLFTPVILLAVALIAACSSTPSNSGSNSSATSTSAPSASSGGSFEGTITSKMFGGDREMEMKYSIKGSRSRIETALAAGGSEMGVMLMDMNSGTQTMLIPQTKTYMIMKWGEAGDQFMQMAKKIGQPDDQPAKAPKITSTGKTETVAGFTCEHWLIGDQQDTDICLAKGLGYFGFGGQGGGVLDKLKNLPLNDKMKEQIDANPEFARFVEGGAFPLKISQIENGQSRTVMEVTAVERKSLDDSLFSVPAGYTEMKIPGMPMGKK
jgi:hypothetical protein